MWNGQQLDNFKVVYDGRDVINNEIEAKLLADSLMGVSESIEEANKILNPQNSAVFIKVKSNFNPGSFEVELIQVLTSPGFQALDIVNYPTLTDGASCEYSGETMMPEPVRRLSTNC